MQIEVTVTQDHIDRGVRCDCVMCPIALALHDATGLYWRVSGLRAENEDGGRVVLPWEALQFQREFDSRCWPGKDIKPFTFEVTDR